MQAGLVRKGGHMVIKGRPCKVLDVSTSKTGKHGHAKCHFVAQDIFTGKKMEDLVPSSHNLAAPNVTRMEYQVRCPARLFVFCSSGTCMCVSRLMPGWITGLRAHTHCCSRAPAPTPAQIIDVDEDGFATLLLEDGSTKNDLKIPLDTNPALCDEIKAKLDEGKDSSVTVLSAMGEDLIIAVKEMTASSTGNN